MDRLLGKPRTRNVVCSIRRTQSTAMMTPIAETTQQELDWGNISPARPISHEKLPASCEDLRGTGMPGTPWSDLYMKVASTRVSARGNISHAVQPTSSRTPPELPKSEKLVRNTPTHGQRKHPSEPRNCQARIPRLRVGSGCLRIHMRCPLTA